MRLNSWFYFTSCQWCCLILFPTGSTEDKAEYLVQSFRRSHANIAISAISGKQNDLRPTDLKNT